MTKYGASISMTPMTVRVRAWEDHSDDTVNLTKADDDKRPWWKQSGSADRVWRHVGNRKLVDNDDGERKLVWKEHLGNASLWTESGCGAMSKYNYDDHDNHEERKQNRSSRRTCGRLTQKNEANTEEYSGEGGRAQVFTSAVAIAVASARKALELAAGVLKQ